MSIDQFKKSCLKPKLIRILNYRFIMQVYKFFLAYNISGRFSAMETTDIIFLNITFDFVANYDSIGLKDTITFGPMKSIQCPDTQTINDSLTEGLEMCSEGAWSPVCDYNWTAADATVNVVCRELGLSTGIYI